MHAFTLQGVEVGGQGGHQRFTLAGFHFGNAALMQHYTAQNLHRERAHSQHPVGGLPADGKRVGQNVVEGFAGGKTRF